MNTLAHAPGTVAPAHPESEGVLGWISTQLALIIPDPAEIRERTPLLAPLTFVLLASVAAAASLQPALGPAFALQPAVAEAARSWLWLAAVAAPALALLKAAMLSALVWAVVILVGREIRFRVLLSANVYGQAILVLSGLFTALVLRARGAAAVQSPADLLVPQGIDVFLDASQSPIVASLAQQTTVFHILWLAFMVWVLPRTTSLSRGASVGVALSLMVVGLVVALIRGVAFS